MSSGRGMNLHVLKGGRASDGGCGGSNLAALAPITVGGLTTLGQITLGCIAADAAAAAFRQWAGGGPTGWCRCSRGGGRLGHFFCGASVPLESAAVAACCSLTGLAACRSSLGVTGLAYWSSCSLTGLAARFLFTGPGGIGTRALRRRVLSNSSSQASRSSSPARPFSKATSAIPSCQRWRHHARWSRATGWRLPSNLSKW